MKTTRTQLLSDLSQLTEKNARTALHYTTLTEDELNWREAPTKWSILECLEHLNRYGDFYLPEIEQRMLSAVPHPRKETFVSGFIGNKFANLMAPKNGIVKNKMKTFKDKNPLESDLSPQTVDRFLQQQERTLKLLDMAKDYDLSKVRTSITIAPWMTLRLGDTFRVIVNHNERHLVQAEGVRQFMEGIPN